MLFITLFISISGLLVHGNPIMSGPSHQDEITAMEGGGVPSIKSVKSVNFDPSAQGSLGKHRRFKSLDVAVHAKHPREADLEANERTDDNIPLPDLAIRANTGMNALPGWRAEALAWQNEFLATTVFLTSAFGGLHSGNSNLENALAFGISLAVAVQLFGQQYMNPLIASCQALVGEISPARAVSMISAEIVGAITASALIKGLTGEVRGVVSIAGVNVVQALFIESVCSFTLAYLVLLISHEQHRVSYNIPVTVGAALTALELFSIPYTSGSLNVARYLGPSIVAREFHRFDWLYLVSNIIGGISATAYYKFVRAVQKSPVEEPLIGPSLALPVRKPTFNENRIQEVHDTN